jgi:acyl dehydratase
MNVKAGKIFELNSNKTSHCTMTLNLDAIKNWDFPVIRQTYTENHTILYALSLSCGMEADRPNDLSFVYEKGLQAIPTLVNNLCHPGFWIADARTGIDASRAVHAHHQVEFHSMVPVAGSVRAQTKIHEVVDRGVDKGAMLVYGREIYDESTDTLIATIRHSTLCRADGGFSHNPDAGRAPSKSGFAHEPERTPDYVVDYVATPQAALIYRLGADPNPLHVDPAVARAAGFDRPILHGLCIFGMVARGAIESLCGGVASRLKTVELRFLAPMFPGEKIQLAWTVSGSSALYQVRIPDRQSVLIASGTVTGA